MTRSRTRIRRNRAVALAGAVAAAVVVLGHQSPESSSWTAPPDIPVLRSGPRENGLDPDLARAVRRAQDDAETHGIELEVTSGRRSPAHQARLLREAIAKHGSHEEAARWVATPETSPHVSGDAVDVGPATAAAWLSQHGAAYGLCQIYANEPWHFELRPGGCPPMYADPTQDPRMQR